MSDYSAYAYRRYKKPKKFFGLIVIIIFIITGFFVANLFFGFISFGNLTKETVTAQSFTFYTIESKAFESKSEAISYAIEVKQSGGSGYLRTDTDQTKWTVIINQSMSEEGNKNIIEAREIRLAHKSHKEIVETLVGTFVTTFEKLDDFIKEYNEKTMTAKEISTQARIAYNNLIELVADFEQIQGSARSPVYAQILVYITRQLLGLNIAWLESENPNYEQVLKNASSWVIFAYADFIESIAS